MSDLIAMSWERGWQNKSPIDPGYLWREGTKGFTQADEIACRSDEDVADFRDRLERLCTALHEEAQLNPLGHFMAFGQIRNAIRKRHALGLLWRSKPNLATSPIAPPILVVGQMRSGTTRVQRLLAADPQHAGTRFCDSLDPVPGWPDWRPLKARAALFMARNVNPWLDTLHPFGPTRTDEEIGWLSAALSPAAFEAQWRIPSYVAWSEQRDAAPVYREFARILRTDAATRGNADQPRVLKCPQFAEDLPALLAEFPDAQVVTCEREAEEVLASSVSMVASQMAYQSDRNDLTALASEWERKIALREARMKHAFGALDRPVTSVAFDDLNADWREAVSRLYDNLALPLRHSAIDAMEKEQRRASRGTHRKHRNQIENFEG